MEAQSHLPQGPTEVKQLFLWPDKVLEKLSKAPCAEAKLSALKDLNERKVLLYSYYTGKGSEGTIGMYLNKALEDAGIGCSGDTFYAMHACEIDSFCQDLLVKMATTQRTDFKHVFGDLSMRFLGERLTMLSSMIPTQAVNNDAKRQLYKEMHAYMNDVLRTGEALHHVDEDCKPPQPMAYCYLHGRMCPTHDTNWSEFPAPVSRVAIHPPSFPPTNKRRRRALRQINSTTSAASSDFMGPPPPPPFQEPERKSSAQSSSDPLRVFVAESSCEDWARYGHRLGSAGPRMQVWVLYVAEIRAQGPHCGFFEISDTCPLAFYQTELLEYDWCSGIVSPFTVGWPCKRPRRFSFFWDATHVEFSGSFDEFLSIFTEAPAMLGDSMLLATDAQRQAMYKEKAEARGLHYAKNQRVPLESCLTAAELKRLCDARADAPLRSSLCGVCVTDLEQNPPYVTPSPYVPPLVKHSKLLCFIGSWGDLEEDAVMFTPPELLAIQGEPCVEHVQSERFMSFAWEALSNIGLHNADRQIAKVAGNSFHLAVMGTFMAYCLSCLTAVDDPTPDIDSSADSNDS